MTGTSILQAPPTRRGRRLERLILRGWELPMAPVFSGQATALRPSRKKHHAHSDGGPYPGEYAAGYRSARPPKIKSQESCCETDGKRIQQRRKKDIHVCDLCVKLPSVHIFLQPAAANSEAIASGYAPRAASVSPVPVGGSWLYPRSGGLMV